MEKRNQVFARTETNGEIIAARQYNLVIGLTLFWGFLVSYFMVSTVNIMPDTTGEMILFVVFYFAFFFIGQTMMHRSSNPVISFIGYNLIVVSFGLSLDIIVSGYDPTIIQNAMFTTALVTVAMMFLGVAFPDFFKKIQGALFIGLIVAVVVQILAVIFFQQALGAIDWVVALVFCGYIGVDWGRANQIPKTMDNAIDSAAALYIDIVNLFIRILRILGRRD